MIADLEKLVRLVEKDEHLKEIVRCETLAKVENSGVDYPIFAFTLGATDPEAPVLFITGGVHGIERIGAQLAWSFLKTTIDRLIWDKSLQDLLKHLRLAILPLVNPVGYHNFTRSNGNHVDLMRNSPVEALEGAPYLLGGQRFSTKLPWYRGQAGEFEPENRALINFFKEQALQSKAVVAVDFHSGFGMRDRLWFPFSYTKTPFDNLPEMHALTHLFEQTYPYHIYQIEPQSKGYLLSGDLWDYLYLDFKAKNKSTVFLPLTLEMGSWLWVRKNPIQFFSRQGIFNPVKAHRVKRTYRRHHLLFDFLMRALHSHLVWSELDPGLRSKHNQLALERWYS